MEEELDFSKFACPNPKCQWYGQTGQGNVRPHGWSSKERGIRLLRCRLCRKDFSERTGTAFFRTRMPEAKLISVVEHIAEGTGMRATGRLCGVALNTVLRIAKTTGEHAEAFHQEKVQHVKAQRVQADEMWSYVGKKRKALRPKRSGR
jgi:transposase-like protein